MKLSIIALLCAFSMPLFAEVKNYVNDEGCTLQVDDTVERVIYTLEYKDQKEVARFSGDYMSVDFKYCPKDTGEIFFTEGSAGYGLMVFCDQNEEATQKGIIDLEIRSNGVVNSFSVASEQKNDQGKWVENKSLSCTGFKLK